jgi:hypothetical protein
MTTVSYKHRFDYGHDADGRVCPMLRFVASNIADPSRSLDLEAGLDSGSERSLFNGRIGVALGLDVLSGPRLTYSTMAGGLLGVLHSVRLIHADLGVFELEVGFSTAEIPRISYLRKDLCHQ